MSIGKAARPFGAILREWRQRRRMSQFDLACDAEIPSQQLASLETGKAMPDQPILMRLARCLDMPLGDRNTLLGSAGFAPAFLGRAFDAPALEIIRRDVETVLSALDPNPAMAVDRHWSMLAANRAVAHLVAGAEPSLLRPPVNLPKLFLHPAGLAPRIVNLPQWRAHVFARLRRRIDASGDPALMDLLEEMRDYPNLWGAPEPSPPDSDDMIALPFRLATIDGVLSFFSTTTSFAAPLDITVAELEIETFLPADADTAEVMRRVHRQAGARHDARPPPAQATVP